MSTLTKILIVLLTLSSIFLCGIVVTYVANADNYRQKYNDLKAQRDSLNKKAKDLTEQVNEKIEQKNELENKLRSEIASLKAKFDKVENDLKNAERQKANLLRRVSDITSVVETSSQTADNQRKLFETTQEKLNKLQAEQIKQRKELKETIVSLIEKMVIIETLEAKNKRLLEDRAELQSRLDQILQPIGEVAAVPVAVTPEKDIARPATPVAVKDIGLKGLVTAVDLKNSMARISIGTADGVREGMRFHVSRSDEYICDILILDVEAQEAVGVLELVQQPPRAGDKVATNL